MTIPYILDMIGTVAFAVSGALVGVRKEMDFYGVTFLALVTAVGGGTTRDIMVGKIPPIIFADYNYLIVSVIMSFAVFFIISTLRARCIFSSLWMLWVWAFLL